MSGRAPFVIDDSNAHLFCEGGPHVGGGFGWAGPHPDHDSYGFADTPIPLIPRSEWSARIKEKQQRGNGLRALGERAGIKVKNQASRPLCWAYASTSCIEYARAIAGHPTKILIPESVAYVVTGGRLRGGYWEEYVDQASKQGPCSLEYADKEYPSYDPSKWKEGWQQDGQNHNTIEYWSVKTFDEVATCLLSDVPISAGYNFWSHQILLLELVEVDGGFGVLFQNSWDSTWGDKGFGTLAPNKATPDGAFALRSTTASDK